MTVEALPKLYWPSMANLRWKESLLFLLLALLLWPLLLLLFYSFDVSVWKWIYASRLDLAKVLGRTLLLAVLTAGLGMIFSIPLAWLTERTLLPGRKFFRILFVLPLAVPPYVGALAYINMIGPRGWLYQSTGFEFPLFSLAGAALILSFFTFPYIYLSFCQAFSKMNVSLEEISASLGKSKSRTFFFITLPLALPAIFAGFNLVALYVLGDFGAVSFLRIDTLTARIYDEFQFANLPAYTGLSVILVASAFLFLLLERFFLREEKFVQESGRSRYKRINLSKKGNFLGLGFCFIVLFLTILIPITYLFIESFGILRTSNETSSFLSVFQKDAMALWVSLKASLCAATLAVIISLCFAPLVLQRNSLGRIFNFGTLLPYVIPGTVLGIVILAGSLKWSDYFSFYHTVWILVFAYLCKYLTQSQRVTLSAISQVNPQLLEAARSLGATGLKARAKVLLPLLMPALCFGWMLVFVSAMKELAATLILKFSPAGIEPLSVRIWTYHNEYTDPSRAATASLILLLFTLIPFAFIYSYLNPKLERQTS